MNSVDANDTKEIFGLCSRYKAVSRLWRRRGCRLPDLFAPFAPQITRITPEMTAALATIPYHRSIATMRRIVCALNSMVISAGSVASTTAKEKAAEPNS